MPAKKSTKNIEVSLEKLLETGAHFGHQARRWNPKTAKFIFSKKDDTLIFDLLKTKEALEEALNFLTVSAKEGKTILLLGTKKQATDKVKEIGQKLDILYINRRWLGGTFTNFNQIKRSIKHMEDLKNGLAEGEFKDRTKKERLLIQREMEKLEDSVGGIKSMDKIPDVMIVIDTHRERSAIKEAHKLGVVKVGIVDSNADPNLVEYPIPMNDDSEKAVHYVLDLIADAIRSGKKTKK